MSAVAPRSTRSGSSVMITAGMVLLACYCALPLLWLLINATKSQRDLFDTFGFGFGDFELWSNISRTFRYQDGMFGRWFLNTLVYVLVGAGGATLSAVLGGYALAKLTFPGKKALLVVVIAAMAVPGPALAIPTFLMFSQLGLANTVWSVIIPSLISPFGLFVMWAFAREAIPSELLEAARCDGAGEARVFRSIALRLLAPGIVSVALLNVVATWNNYFLPRIMLSDPQWYPLTVGLDQWNRQAGLPGGEAVHNLVITGSVLTVVPIIAVFLLLQRYLQSGVLAGSFR